MRICFAHCADVNAPRASCIACGRQALPEPPRGNLENDVVNLLRCMAKAPVLLRTLDGEFSRSLAVLAWELGALGAKVAQLCACWSVGRGHVIA